MAVFDKLWRALLHEVKTLRGSIHRRLSHSREYESNVVDTFHKLYFDGRAFNMTWRNTQWMGHAVLKCPLDLWHYQEILHEVRPDLIIETGTAFGGSALHMAHMCDILNHGRVITIDLDPKRGRPEHPRITYLQGSSVSPEIVAQVADAAKSVDRVMVVLDSDHSKDHVLAELRALAGLVTTGSYLIVEDTNLNGHPVDPQHGPGPMEALDDFLRERSEFVIDDRWEKFFLSFNPRGYLKRVASWMLAAALGGEFTPWPLFATMAELL